MLSDHERKRRANSNVNFRSDRSSGLGHAVGHTSRFADILALVTSVVSTATLLAVGSVGVALQPATATGPEAEALTRLHQLLVEARSL